MPRPMPLVEPVTMALLPSSRPLIASCRVTTPSSRRAWRIAWLDAHGDLDSLGRAVRREGLLDAVEREAVRDQRLDAHPPVAEQPHGLGELVLVDHRAQDPHLPPHDGEEVDARRLV